MDEDFDRKLDEYKRLWTTDKDNYILAGEEADVRAGGNCAIVNMTASSMLIIEDINLARIVKEKMLIAGVRVGDPNDINIRKEYIKQRLASARKS